MEPDPQLAVADGLRAAIHAFTANVHDAESLARAHGLLAQVTSTLAGPPETLHEDFEGTDPATWRHYIARSAFGGGRNPLGPRVDYDDPPGDVAGPFRVTGRLTLGWPHQGGPGMVHGGVVAGYFDHFLGLAQGSGQGFTCATVRLAVRYVRPTPLDRELTFAAWLDEPAGRDVVGHATCHAGEVLTADAEGLFRRIDDMTALGQRGQRGS